jgi:predicted dehydrogenase
MKTSCTTRRRFLAQSALASTAFAAPLFIPARVFGANERIVTGHIGIGHQGKGNLSGFGSTVGAVCDVDATHLQAAVKKSGGKPYADYRKLLEQKDLDAIVITTPDHWHALMTIAACNAGKHVYVEKPLSLTVVEGRAMVNAARKNHVIVQTGSQQRSGSEFLKACEYVRNGRLGKLKAVLVGVPAPNYPGKLGPDSDPPAALDYQMWLGAAPDRPYNEKRVHYNFRFWWDYSGGQMTNFGAHHLDIAHWGIGVDGSGPLEIEAVEAVFNPHGDHEVTEKCRVAMKYPGDVSVTIGQAQKDIPMGTTFIGEKGRIHVNRGSVSSDPGEILKEPLRGDALRLYASRGHKQDFIDCIKSGELPCADVEIGHRTATACHLANIACRTGEKFQWDAAKEQVAGSQKAAGLLSREYRKPWMLDLG